MRKRPVLWFVLLLCVGIVGTAVVCGIWLRQQNQPIPFDAAAWRRPFPGEHEEGLRQRGRMLHDLLDRYQLVGMARDEVEGLLGPPDSTTAGDPPMLIYSIGPAQRSVWGTRRPSLQIDFNPEDGKVRFIKYYW